MPLSEYSTSGIPNGVVSAGAATCDSGSKKVSGYKWIAVRFFFNKFFANQNRVNGYKIHKSLERGTPSYGPHVPPFPPRVPPL